jgi:predicted alpha/beta superfamily hydrolase
MRNVRPGLFSLCFLLTALAACQTTSPLQPPAQSRVTPLDYLPALKGDYFKLESKAVGRPFHIYVRLPESYAQKPDARYPVVYLLDGDSLFPLLAPEHLFLNYDEGIPEAIVVGIAYGSFDPSINKRGYDFSGPSPNGKPDEGGAPAFQTFLETELIPEVEKRYRTEPTRRVLVGQSRGGHMVLYSAFTKPDLFWGRIASNAPLDPWREQLLSKPASATRKDLGLVVTSGTRDRPRNREDALTWFKAWEGRTDGPWAIHMVNLEGGTHAADIANSYRAGMLWLFGSSKGQLGQ